MVLNQGFETSQADVAQTMMPEMIVSSLGWRSHLRLDYSAPTQQGNPVSSHCSVEARNAISNKLKSVLLNHNSKGMFRGESQHREEILIEVWDMEDTRE